MLFDLLHGQDSQPILHFARWAAACGHLAPWSLGFGLLRRARRDLKQLYSPLGVYGCLSNLRRISWCFCLWISSIYLLSGVSSSSTTCS